MLLDRLRETSYPEQVIDTMGYMPNNTAASVFNNFETESWSGGNGTRHGSVWSPLLFCFYIIKNTEVIPQMNMGCFFNDIRCNIIGYANDLVLLDPSSGALQVLLNKLQSLLNERGLKIIVEKCPVIVFETSKSDHQKSNIRMTGQEIKRVQK